MTALAAAGRASSATDDPNSSRATLRQLLADRAFRRVVVATVLLTLACYAQYESGIPAYALTVLGVSPAALGVGLAANALIVVAFTVPLIAITRRVHAVRLLSACALAWTLTWVALAVPLLGSGHAALLLILAFVCLALGETVLLPVLLPYAASMVFAGAQGRALAAITAAETAAAMAGPALSGHFSPSTFRRCSLHCSWFSVLPVSLR